MTTTVCDCGTDRAGWHGIFCSSWPQPASNENAPDAAATAVEGNDQNTYQGEPIMPDSTRETRSGAARRGTIAADPDVDISDAPIVTAKTVKPSEDALPRQERLAETHIAGLPVLIRETVRGSRVHVWRDPQGSWWRNPGTVSIRPALDGDGRAIVVTLYVGANESDLKWLLEWVDRARSGAGLDSDWQHVSAEWADDHTFVLDYDSRPYADPYTHRDKSPKVTVCGEPLCIHKWHTEDSWHELDSVYEEPHPGVTYSISVEKLLAEDENDEPDGWFVNVHTSEFYGTPDDVARFVNDLQWMQQECRRANEADSARTREEAAA
ncbi:hypothetical protein [Microbacterium paludicola]|uniref:hypothetical protein n=1 Tax=Microbacterium paludicola TaxID=300019 RepID=UPI0031E0BB9C